MQAMQHSLIMCKAHMSKMEKEGRTHLRAYSKLSGQFNTLNIKVQEFEKNLNVL